MSVEIKLTDAQLYELIASWRNTDAFWVLVENEVDKIIKNLSALITWGSDGRVVVDVYDTPEGASVEFDLCALLEKVGDRGEFGDGLDNVLKSLRSAVDTLEACQRAFESQ